MKTIAIIFTLLCSLICQQLKAQRPWKEYLVPGAAMLVSGFIDGTDEALIFHYKHGFKARFTGANDQFWDPCKSWKNKYKNGDPAQGPKFFGSTEALVVLTDGHHLLRLSRVFLDMGAMTYCANTNHPELTKHRFINWKTVAQDFIVMSAIRTIGFHIAYNVVFPLQGNGPMDNKLGN